ncbi:aldehyde dehydrogenase [Rhizoctonia solani AG-1 IB]|uniref:Aldehyde dehydrogenase n=1 Tax=Thanatephorus cucumeris (strain AG1-IB / isolate 7/3/14) TaxID=1108050 RepID=M5CFZ3_THACB|nr:aldehyde dehydrogenase [Rhizoctonia solani AG-1 IB]
MVDYTHIINGKAVTSLKKMSVINPANMQRIAEVPLANKDQLDEAVAAARTAFYSWSTKPQEDRAAVLFKIASVIEDNIKEYKQLLTSEQGKTLANAEFELGACIAALRGTAELRLPDKVLFEDDELKILERRVPIGVISFTGSTETGKKVMAGASAGLKRLTLELGGKDPAIVLPDVDPSKITPELFWAAFINNGQTCFAAKRIYVHEKIYDEFRDQFVKFAKTIKTGDGMDPSSQLGPVQNVLQYKRVVSFIEDSRANNHTFALGGVVSPDPTNGLFIPVSIVDNPPDHSKIVREEPFGPILPLLKWSEEAEVIRRANDTEYGLSASVWGKDTEAVERIARQIQAGTVCMNEFNPIDRYSAFGGHKQSGLGVENGIHGLLSFTNIQSLTLKKKPGFL